VAKAKKPASGLLLFSQMVPLLLLLGPSAAASEKLAAAGGGTNIKQSGANAKQSSASVDRTSLSLHRNNGISAGPASLMHGVQRLLISTTHLTPSWPLYQAVWTSLGLPKKFTRKLLYGATAVYKQRMPGHFSQASELVFPTAVT
jgi:hypothetical protein